VGRAFEETSEWEPFFRAEEGRKEYFRKEKKILNAGNTWGAGALFMLAFRGEKSVKESDCFRVEITPRARRGLSWVRSGRKNRETQRNLVEEIPALPKKTFVSNGS